MYAFIEYRDNYVKKNPENLWQYSSDKLDHDMVDSKSFKIKSRLKNSTGYNGIANLKVANQ